MNKITTSFHFRIIQLWKNQYYIQCVWQECLAWVVVQMTSLTRRTLISSVRRITSTLMLPCSHPPLPFTTMYGMTSTISSTMEWEMDVPTTSQRSIQTTSIHIRTSRTTPCLRVLPRHGGLSTLLFHSLTTRLITSRQNVHPTCLNLPKWRQWQRQGLWEDWHIGISVLSGDAV